MKTINKITKFFSLMFAVLLISFGAYAQETQLELLRYQFEEGSGSIVLDSSGNNFHATNTGANYDTTQATFGTYAMDFDGNQDYLTTISGSNIPDKISFSFWMDMDQNPQTTLFVIYGLNDYFKILVDPDSASNIELQYKDVNDLTQSQTLSNNPFLINTMYHLVLNFDFVNQTFTVYRNGILDGNGNLNFQVSREDGSNTLRIGADDLGTNEHDGDLDEFRIFFGNLNQSQAQSLFNSNTVNLFVLEPEPVEEEKVIIIDSYSPLEGETVNNNVEFNLNLFQNADCDFYLDNNKLYNFENIVATSFIEFLEEGLHSYFWYCSIMNNNTKQYQLSNLTTFNVVTPPTTATFKVVGIDFDPTTQSLYLTSPCPNEGYSAIGTDYVGYGPKYNKDGVEWWPFIDGIVSINTTANTHEFCIFNGRVIINEQGKTTNYNVQSKEGILKVGEIDIPNELNNYFELRVEKLEVFDVTNPKAYTDTLGAFLMSFIMFLLGGLIMWASAKSESKVGVLIGGVLLLGAFGLSLGGVLTLINI